MVPILNHIGVHVASLGNHDFDFGIEELQKRMEEFSFPWLLSNVLDRKTGEPLAGAEQMIEMEWNGMRLGIIGLVEKEWLAAYWVSTHLPILCGATVLTGGSRV